MASPLPYFCSLQFYYKVLFGKKTDFHLLAISKTYQWPMSLIYFIFVTLKGLSQCHGCQCNAQEHVSVMRCVSFSTNAPVFLPRCCQDVSTVSPLSVVSCPRPPGTSNFPSVHSSPLTRPHHTYLTNTKQISNTFQSFWAWIWNFSIKVVFLQQQS